jgi:hypothetical protein
MGLFDELFDQETDEPRAKAGDVVTVIDQRTQAVRRYLVTGVRRDDPWSTTAFVLPDPENDP